MKLGHFTLGLTLAVSSALAWQDRLAARSPPGSDDGSPGDKSGKGTSRIHGSDHNVQQLKKNGEGESPAELLRHNVGQRKSEASHRRIGVWAEKLKKLHMFDTNVRFIKWKEAHHGKPAVHELMKSQYGKQMAGGKTGVEAMQQARDGAAREYKAAFEATHLPIDELRQRAHMFLKDSPSSAQVFSDLGRLHRGAIIR